MDELGDATQKEPQTAVVVLLFCFVSAGEHDEGDVGDEGEQSSEAVEKGQDVVLAETRPEAEGDESDGFSGQKASADRILSFLVEHQPGQKENSRHWQDQGDPAESAEESRDDIVGIDGRRGAAGIILSADRLAARRFWVYVDDDVRAEKSARTI